MTVTVQNAQQIWDNASETHRNEAMHALMREASRSRMSARRRARQGIYDHAEKLNRRADTMLAAMVLLGAENIEEIQENIEEIHQIVDNKVAV